MKTNRSLQDFPDMPTPQQQWDLLQVNPLLQEQLAYDPEQMRHFVDQRYPQFRPQQKSVYDNVMDSVTNESGRLFFLHSAGGCGKTHVCNTIAAAIRAESKVALLRGSPLAMASQLLEGWSDRTFTFQNPHPCS